MPSTCAPARAQTPPSRGLTVTRWLAVLAVVGAVMATLGCNEQRRYEVLSFFFDGVPQPGGTSADQQEYIEGPWGIRLRADDPRAEELRARFAARELSGGAAAGRDEQPTVEFLHTPYEDRLCNGCHVVAESFAIPTSDIETCRDCHAQHVKFEPTDWVHGPVASGQCMTCHEPHKSRYRGLLVNRQPDLCFECHDAQGTLQQPYHAQILDGLLGAAGANAAVDPASGDPTKLAGLDASPADSFVCTRCHDPHAAGNRLLLADSRSYRLRKRNAVQTRSAHNQWTDDECGRCHLRQQSNVLVANVDAVCVDCHHAVAAEIRDARVTRAQAAQVEPDSQTRPVDGPRLHEALLDGGCTTCHTPHQSVLDKLIKPEGEDLCFRCHKPEEVQTPQHPVVHRVDCLRCHTGHHVERPHMLKPGIPVDRPRRTTPPSTDQARAPTDRFRVHDAPSAHGRLMMGKERPG